MSEAAERPEIELDCLESMAMLASGQIHDAMLAEGAKTLQFDEIAGSFAAYVIAVYQQESELGKAMRSAIQKLRENGASDRLARLTAEHFNKLLAAHSEVVEGECPHYGSE